MLIYAHRGASVECPENTLLAFRRALEIGVDGMELDLHASADGVPVVIHDRDLARTTNGSGDVDALPLSALSALDAGRGEPIPTLSEVLDLVGDAAHLDLEIKERGIERAVLEVLGQHAGARWAISSFDWETLLATRESAPRAELWPLAEAWSAELPAVARKLASPVVALAAASFTPASSAELRDAGLRAMVWTVNDVEEARRVENLGAFAVCTDDPRLVADALRRQ